MENGYRMHGVKDGPSIDGFGGNEQEFRVEGEATQDNMHLDGQLTQEQFHSTVVGCISNSPGGRGRGGQALAGVGRRAYY